MKKFITSKYVQFFLGILFLFLLWFLVAKFIDVDNMIFPGPQDTLKEVTILLKKRSTLDAFTFSIVRLFLGFAISFIAAFILGLIVNTNKTLYNFLTPLMTFFKSVPTATLIFLFIVLSGVSYASMLVVITVTFPILYESIVSSLKHVENNVVESAKVEGANKVTRLLSIQLPIGVPYIILGVVSSFSLAFKVEVMSEVIMGYTKGGIGAMIKNSQLIDPTNLTTMFAYSFIAVALMLIITIIANIIKPYIIKRFGIVETK